MPDGRVLISFDPDDGPLDPTPTWTRVDDPTGDVFPPQFVTGYDTQNGRQSNIGQTETGTATVYINDRAGLFDDRNSSSPYQGYLSGRQIKLQLYNPVSATWESQWRGLIDDYSYDIMDVLGADGKPINATIKLECVDVFDYLNGYGLTPGLDGMTPPPGSEDQVWYAGTSGSVEDRIIEILTDAGIDPAMYVTSSGNVNVLAVLYDLDSPALTALRDAADAEFPYLANISVDRLGRFCFRGRYSRFDPDALMGPDWNFQRWPVGDGTAIVADDTRAQIRVLSYSRERSNIINAALCYQQGTQPSDMAAQVYANDPSIAAYGRHESDPISDLLTATYVGPGTSPDGNGQCALYAQLLVLNQKDPRIVPTAVQLKAMRPSDPRAETTWNTICGADINDIVNIAVGYPDGTGLAGDSPTDDYYIEGRALTVRPLNPDFDYVELDLNVSPAIWSMDTHSVFPAHS